MKKGIALLSSLIFAGSLAAVAFTASAADVEDSMKAMGKSFRSVMKDQDAASLKKDLTTFRAAAVEAQAGKVSAKRSEGYAEGMKELVAQTDVAIKFADEGKFTEAKAEVEKLKDIMQEYHGKLNVK